MNSSTHAKFSQLLKFYFSFPLLKTFGNKFERIHIHTHLGVPVQTPFSNTILKLLLLLLLQLLLSPPPPRPQPRILLTITHHYYHYQLLAPPVLAVHTVGLTGLDHISALAGHLATFRSRYRGPQRSFSNAKASLDEMHIPRVRQFSICVSLRVGTSLHFSSNS